MLSIIIPTYNEERIIEQALKQVKQLCSGKDCCEIIVSDGGSNDKTVPIAKRCGCLLVEGAQGRAAQMNAGARKAKGDIFLFLHVDSILPKGAVRAIENAIHSGVEAGCFRTRYTKRHWLLKLVELHVVFRSKFWRTYYGDQGIFIKPFLFEELGGFKEMPLFEDVEISHRLRSHKTKLLDLSIITSTRRFDKVGYLKMCFGINLIRLLYFFGVSVERIRDIYYRL